MDFLFLSGGLKVWKSGNFGKLNVKNIETLSLIFVCVILLTWHLHKLKPLLEGMSAVIFLLSRYDYLQTMLTPLIRSECTVLKQFNQAH